MRRRDGWAWILALPLVALLLLPIVALLSRSSLPSLQGEVLDAVKVSLRTTAISVVAILIFGTPLALILAKRRFFGRGILEALVTLPAVLPPAAAGLGLLLALGRKGILGAPLGISLAFTSWAVVLAQIYVAAPFYVRPLASAFRGIHPEWREAAVLDGAGSWSLFRLIDLPLVKRALFVALTLAWARALGEFGATALFAGNRVGETQTLPLAIYLGFETDIDAAAALAVLLLAVALAVIGITSLVVSREGDD